MTDASSIFDALSRGEAVAAEQLLPLVYSELRKLAARQMAAIRAVAAPIPLLAPVISNTGFLDSETGS